MSVLAPINAPFAKYAVDLDTMTVYNVRTHKAITPQLKDGRRLYVSLVNDTGATRTIQLATAVLRAVKGPPPDKEYEASHLDGDSSNNNPSNLIWETKNANLERYRAEHNYFRGTANPNAKLSSEEREDIMERYGCGTSVIDIQYHFEVFRDIKLARSTIYRIIKSKE